MIGLVAVGLIGAGLFFASRANAADGLSLGGSVRLYDLPDIAPADQGGNFKKDYDLYFESVADETGVPFALLKAHAIRESSLNEAALRDENHSKRTDRIGWVSRGLMQVLFWPGSTRFEQFGYTSKDLNDGALLTNPYINIKVAAKLIAANLKACSGNLRDAVNMYNAGVKESVRVAPLDYVNKVISSYETLIKRKV